MGKAMEGPVEGNKKGMTHGGIYTGNGESNNRDRNKQFRNKLLIILYTSFLYLS
jgi:hypothetical protein